MPGAKRCEKSKGHHGCGSTYDIRSAQIMGGSMEICEIT